MKASLPLKSIIFLLVTITISSATAAVTTHFRDVQPGSWYEAGANNMNQMGIMKGYDNGLFGVNDTVTRAQLATILNRYVGVVDAPFRQRFYELQMKLSRELLNSSWIKYTEDYKAFRDLSALETEKEAFNGNLEEFLKSKNITPYFKDKSSILKVIDVGGTAIDRLHQFYIIDDWNFYGPFLDDIARLKKEATGS